jgi:hypothetical protein
MYKYSCTYTNVHIYALSYLKYQSPTAWSLKSWVHDLTLGTYIYMYIYMYIYINKCVYKCAYTYI